MVFSSKHNRCQALFLALLLAVVAFFAGAQELAWGQPGYSDNGSRASGTLYSVNSEEELEFLAAGRLSERASYRRLAAHKRFPRPLTGLRLPSAIERAWPAVFVTHLSFLPPPDLRGPPAA